MSHNPRVVHIHLDRALIARLKLRGLYARVDRRTRWGNPIKMADRSMQQREDVVARYRLWLPQHTWLMKDIGELRGKSLGCWCRSADGKLKNPCHADMLLDLANR